MNTARKAFDAMRTEKTAAGLHPEQAALVALRQIVRDARNGEIPMDEALQIVIAEETRCGATGEAAQLTAQALSEGKTCDFAKRDFGAQPRRRRTRAGKPNPYWQAEMDARSAELSAWANGTLTNHGGSLR